MSFSFGLLTGIFICIGSLVAAALCRSFTTLIHELGHAIPSLIFTKGDVVVFVGSYGDKEKGLSLKLGRLTIYFTIDLFGLNLGLCTHHKPAGFLASMLIILGGPFASLLIAIPLSYMAYKFDLGQTWIFVIGIFLIAALFDFFVNIIPSNDPLRLPDGEEIFNDGRAFLNLIDRQYASEEFVQLEELYRLEKYDELIDQANDVLLEKKDRSVSKLLIDTYIIKENYDNALSVYSDHKQDYSLTYDDYFTMGMIYKSQGNYLEALKHFDVCFGIRINHVELNQAMGEIKSDLGEHKRAVQRFTGALVFNEKYYPAFIERAKVYIKEKMYDAAQQDLEIAMTLSPEDFDIYYNLGIIYDRQKNYRQSIDFLQKAEILQPDFPGLAYKIELLKEYLPRVES